jgi:Flp pilus assembly protein TadG
MATLSRRRRTSHSDRGSEVLELAFALPLLLLVIAGIMDFGFFFERYEVVTNAAREGARMAVLSGYTCNSTSTSDVFNRVQTYLNASGLNNTPTVTCGVVTGATSSIGLVQVQVTYPTSLPMIGTIAALVGGGSMGTVNLTAIATMRPEADTTGGS